MAVYFDEDKQIQKLSDLRMKEEEELAQILSKKYGVGYVDLSGVTINTDALRLIPETLARETHSAVFKMVGKIISIAVQTPNRDDVKKVIHDLKEAGYVVNVLMTSMQSLDKAWSRYKDLSFAMATKAGSLDISNEEIAAFVDKVKTINDIKNLIDNTVQEKKIYRISKIIVIIMAGAISLKGSDIHIEPEQDVTRIRYRLDGVLVDIISFDNETYELLLSRLKLLGGMKLNIKQNAQDGRFSVVINNTEIEIRMSILPGSYGESIVMRLLDPQSINVTLDSLGIPKKLMDIFEREISKPDGMILTTGPTGSGKTTTLYAFIQKVYNEKIKVITIEDPVEYHLKGIVQTQVEVEKGYTFANGLRSTLRQDPDVILVGEIRDNETAEIAVQSALTGHLVFSTLHTNNAFGAFPRMIDLGVNPKILTSAINVIIAQRLIRRVCTNCAVKVPIPENRKEFVDKIIKSIKAKGESILQTSEIFEAKAGGCELCHYTGYKGRVGLYEAVLVDEAVEECIFSNPSDREVAKAAINQDILTLAEDGMQKVFEGISTIEELDRVVDIAPGDLILKEEV